MSEELVGYLVGLILGGLMGFYYGISYMEEKAVENNVACYEVDKSGDVEFIWEQCSE